MVQLKEKEKIPRHQLNRNTNSKSIKQGQNENKSKIHIETPRKKSRRLRPGVPEE